MDAGFTSLKLPFQFNATKLKNELANLTADDWIDHFVKQNYSGNWRAIGLRIQKSAENMHPIMSIVSNPSENDWIDSCYIKQAPYFQEVLSNFSCPIQSVRLMSLTSGSEIKEHSDHLTTYEEGCIRLHIPIQTNKDVKFYLDKQIVVMQEGECWYLNLSKPHAVINQGETDRVHMVIDAQVNDWVRDVFSST